MNQMRRLRKNAGFKNAKSAAQAIGISTVMLYYIEQGLRCPSLEVAIKMKDVYKCSFDDIFLPYTTTDSNNLVSKDQQVI